MDIRLRRFCRTYGRTRFIPGIAREVFPRDHRPHYAADERHGRCGGHMASQAGYPYPSHHRVQQRRRTRILPRDGSSRPTEKAIPSRGTCRRCERLRCCDTLRRSVPRQSVKSAGIRRRRKTRQAGEFVDHRDTVGVHADDKSVAAVSGFHDEHGLSDVVGDILPPRLFLFGS